MIHPLEVIVIGMAMGALLGAMVRRWLQRRRVSDTPTKRPVGIILLGMLLGGAAGMTVGSLMGEGIRAVDDLPAVTTTDAFQSVVLDSDLPVLIFVHTQRCPACHQTAPAFRAAAATYGETAVFATLDADAADPALLDLLDLRGQPVPQLQLYYRGQRVGEPQVGAGAINDEQIGQMLDTVPATDHTGQ
jgi:thiol-disulfide isomerase/thioredoxin